MMNDEDTIGWLYDILWPLEFAYTPLEVLETESRYPGLFSDLAIEAWQRKLIKEQLDTSKT